MSFKRSCLDCGRVIAKGSLCPRCQQARDAQSPSALRPSGGTRAWRRLRDAVLARDPICTICHVEPSTIADHIELRGRGGTDTMANLRGVCEPCHLTRHGGRPTSPPRRSGGAGVVPPRKRRPTLTQQVWIR